MENLKVMLLTLHYIAACLSEDVQKCSAPMFRSEKSGLPSLEIHFSDCNELRGVLQTNSVAKRFFDKLVRRRSLCDDNAITIKAPTTTTKATVTSQKQTTKVKNFFATVEQRTTEMSTIAQPETSARSDCNVTYDGGCFRIFLSKYQNVTLGAANETCTRNGFRLGNIYDQNHYAKIFKWLEDRTKKSYTGLWTGMNRTKDGEVVLSTADESDWNVMWYPEYPKKKPLTTTLAIRSVRGRRRPFRCGLINVDPTEGDKLSGAFCQRDL